jgi:hypothetical protein|tara:strand:+ start:499 stop:609 length:111 start_codon:yes stop_codon:yes gene_type:complete
MAKQILLLINNYSSKLQVWSWQKLWGDRKKGLGYKK